MTRLASIPRMLARATAPLGFCMVMLGSTAVSAQAQDSPMERSSFDPARTPHRVAADTGRMAWGHQDFTRYTDAMACERAVRSVADESWRDDPLEGVDRDTLATAAIAVAHGCGDYIRIDESPSDALQSLLRVTLAAGRDQRAAEILTRIVQVAPDAPARVRALLIAERSYLTATPARLNEVRHLVARIDTLTARPESFTDARTVRFRARAMLAMHFGRASYDLDSAYAYVNAALAEARAMSADAREKAVQNILVIYDLAFSLANDRGSSLSEQQQLLRDGAAMLGMAGYKSLLLQKQLMMARTAIYGTSAPTIFEVKDTGAAALVPGVPTFVLRLNPACRRDCAPTFAVLRGLAIRYSRALNVVVVTKTQGYVPWGGPVPSDTEVQQRLRYYRDVWGVHTPVLVERATVARRADGVVESGATRSDEWFNGWSIGNAVLIDADGVVRWMGTIDRARDLKRLERLVDRLGTMRNRPSP